MEHTVLCDVVNKCFQQVTEGHDLYSASFLVRPRGCGGFRQSRAAVLLISETTAGDIVVNDAGVIGMVIAFWQHPTDVSIYAEVDAYECLANDARVRSQARTHRVFFDSRTIIDACVWYTVSPTVIRVSVPPALLFLWMVGSVLLTATMVVTKKTNID